MMSYWRKKICKITTILVLLLMLSEGGIRAAAKGCDGICPFSGFKGITPAVTVTPPAATASSAGSTLSRRAFLQLDAGTILQNTQIDHTKSSRYFVVCRIHKKDAVYQRILGKSYVPNKNISYKDLRYIKVLHYNYKHQIQVGELLVNQRIAARTKQIFYHLFQKEYEIRSMYLVEKYWVKNHPEQTDTASCRAGNTSGFFYRTMTGGSRLSNHAYGLAIDINTRENPYASYKNGRWNCPVTQSAKYLTRKPKHHMITKKDPCYRLFTRAGFQWGGNWTNPKDYQHFEYKKN